MHHHGHKESKLSLEQGPRKALIRGQVTSLVVHEQITTTLTKAKTIAPYFERMVTKAKQGDLHNKRQIRAFLLTDKAAQKLVEEIAPRFKDRKGGYTRIVKIENRRGDNAPMAVVSLTELANPAEKAEKKPEADSKVKKPAAAKTQVKAKAADKPKAKTKPEAKK
ncbi:MAG TPA: 50S ribosomal protein L17 [Candidatus Dormibacteraeota bacterium]|nr:50S ribosomal protein L17 [Candidatus Dormibacteraeota bacterium]